MKTFDVKNFVVNEDARGILSETVANEYNKAVTTGFLHDHVSHEAYTVRYGVAINKNTSPNDLRTLSKDESAMVRFGVAANKRVDPLIVEELMNDENEFVRGLASYRMGKIIDKDIYMILLSKGYIYRNSRISRRAM